jgi:hypothetical protein
MRSIRNGPAARVRTRPASAADTVKRASCRGVEALSARNNDTSSLHSQAQRVPLAPRHSAHLQCCDPSILASVHPPCRGNRKSPMERTQGSGAEMVADMELRFRLPSHIVNRSRACLDAKSHWSLKRRRERNSKADPFSAGRTPDCADRCPPGFRAIFLGAVAVLVPAGRQSSLLGRIVSHNRRMNCR